MHTIYIIIYNTMLPILQFCFSQLVFQHQIKFKFLQGCHQSGNNCVRQSRPKMSRQRFNANLLVDFEVLDISHKNYL